MSETSHERWNEELAAYLLGALAPGEAEEVERHLEGCDRCQAELRWLTPARDALPETVVRLEAPPELRERLLSEVRADARRAEGAARPARRRLGWFRNAAWRPLAAAAALLLIVAAVVGYEVGSGGSGGGSPTKVEVDGPTGVVAAVSMEGTVHGRIELSDVHPLPHDRVLEAWLERDGKVEAVPTLFVPNSEGEAATTLGDMRGVSTVMVTQEPPGGSSAPTSKPIVEVPIPQT